ncbi:MAG: CHAD domain-containing protein [Thermoanaerobacteraceae bacterium]
MRIILLRHGKAEKKGDDKERTLTKKGRKDLKANLPFLASYLKDKNPIIWTSNLNRAIDTSNILIQELKDAKIIYHDFIENGNYNSFINTIKEFDNTNTIIIIGHEPHLSKWCYNLSGRQITFDKGFAVELKIDLENNQPAKILWAYPLNEFYKLNIPVFQKTVELLESIESQSIAFIKNPDDVETVHQIRVLLRKFRSLISFLKPYIIPVTYNTVQSNLRYITRLFSHIRELDILIMSIQENSKEDELHNLYEYFLTQRKREQRKIIKKITRSSCMDFIFQTYIQILEALDFDKLKKNFNKDVALKYINKWDKTIINQLENFSDFNFTTIHNIRLKAKKIRYLGDLFPEYFNEKPYNQIIKNSKKLQTYFGDICDTIKNQEIVNNINKNSDFNLSKESEIFIKHQSSIIEKYKNEFNTKSWIKSFKILH